MINQTSLEHLFTRNHWVFDMDGTLTIAQHDFDAIRDALGLPEGLPILESLAAMPDSKSEPIHQRLNEIELEIAAESKSAEGAHLLLEKLLSKGSSIGILTRNNAINIEVTLKAAGLDGYFKQEDLLSRDCVQPKPAPDGILQLLGQWKAEANNAVMVGDHLHDLLSGRAAGTKTLYVDPCGEFVFQNEADVCIHSLNQLLN